MLNITLDKSKKRTYTRQIYQAIRNKILAGEVKSGDALPPYRELSQTLAVSKNTILAAYDMLVSDGMLRSVGGSGFYVAEGMKRVSAPVFEKVKTKLQKFIKKIQVRHATPSWKTASAVRKPSISRG